MNSASALKAVQDSLARGSSTPCGWESDRDAYILRKSQELLQKLIEPVPASVVGRAHDYDNEGLKPYIESFAIAHSDDHWLLYLTSSNHFALAYGKDPAELRALGFDSPDALTEWLG